MDLAEVLIIAQEECAGVSQEISKKILRFGWTEETKVCLENGIPIS